MRKVYILVLLLVTEIDAYSPGNWTAVPRIIIDPERQPLEVMTNTPNGTWEEMVLHFYNSRTESVGGLNIWFDKDPSKEPYFKISWCDIWTERRFRNLPTATEKIWRIEKTSSKMKIHCNDVEVAEVYKSECEDSFADEFWRKDIDWVWFLNSDRASDYYRPYQPGAIPDFSPDYTHYTVEEGKKCDNFYTDIGHCDGWVLSSEEECKEYCTRNKSPNSTVCPAPSEGCRYAVWWNNTGWCHLAGDYCRPTSEKNATMFVRGDWKTVELFIDIDFETTPLEVKTDSVLGSDDILHFRIYNAEEEAAGSIEVYFESIPKYSLAWCMNSKKENFPTSLPSAREKVWRFTLIQTPEYRLLIHCNEVEVLNFVMSESCVEDRWSRHWTKDVAKMNFFFIVDPDNASHHFRLLHPESCSAGSYKPKDMVTCVACPGNSISSEGAAFCNDCADGTVANHDKTQCEGCTGFPLNMRYLRTSSKFPVAPGTNVTITCADKDRVLVGDGIITCQTGTSYTFDETPHCENKDAICQDQIERNDFYGTYTWPATKLGEVAEIPCSFNSKQMAYKTCNQSTKTFDDSNFQQCLSIHEQISGIRNSAENLASTEDQIAVSEDIQKVTKDNSAFMKSDDIKITAEIIDKLIEFDEGEESSRELGEEVRKNILKTVDDVHRSANTQEMAKDATASSMRSSIDKFADKISRDTEDELIFLREQTMGVVIAKTEGDEISFAIASNDQEFRNSSISGGYSNNSTDNIKLFAARVPANEQKSPITAVLYESATFYPDNNTVEDFSAALAGHFADPENSKKTQTKVISMIAEIKYAEIEESVEFKNGTTMEMDFKVKNERPRVYYKMALKSSYKCAYFNTEKEVWITGEESGCITSTSIDAEGIQKVHCQCPHMTSFAVLMSFDSDYDPLEAKVSSVLLGISLACLILTILAYLPAKEMLKRRPVRTNLLLVTSLILSLAVFFLMEHVVATNVKNNNVPQETDTASAPCAFIAFLMNYLWLCQMAWMVCEAAMMYRDLVSGVLNPYISKYMLKSNLVCWGVPLIFPIIGIIWGQADYANPNTCFLRKRYGLASFYGPVVLCILFNIGVFIGISWSLFWKEEKDDGISPVERKKKKRPFKFAVTVMTLLGVGWVLGFFLIIDGVNHIGLRWLFIICNSTQGIIIFILYVVLNQDLMKVWKKLLRIASPATPSHSSGSTPGTRFKAGGKKKAGVAPNTESTEVKMDKLSGTASSIAPASPRPPRKNTKDEGSGVYDKL